MVGCFLPLFPAQKPKNIPDNGTWWRSTKRLFPFFVSNLQVSSPTYSYIHAEDFESAADLVRYLDYLNKNDTAYLEYHQWRSLEPTSHGGSLGLTAQMTCDLCLEIKRRKEAGWAKKTIRSVASWWWLDVHDDKCINTSLVPEWIKQFPTVKMNETYDELRD